jgi:methylmalonic aciduria homocystinuria type C protein
MGVCLHGKYGGWFAMRCVYLFKNFHVDENLRRKDPIDPLHNDFNRIFDTLKKFNDSWRDSTYRSTFTVLQKYSHIQQEYFKTVPNDRKRLLEKWLRFKDQNSLCTFYESEHMYRTDYKQYLINNFYFV